MSQKGSLLNEYIRTKREVMRLSQPVQKNISTFDSPSFGQDVKEENHLFGGDNRKGQLDQLKDEREVLRRVEVQLVQEIKVAGLRKSREIALLNIAAKDLRCAHDQSASIATQIVSDIYSYHAQESNKYQTRLDEALKKIDQLNIVTSNLRASCEALSTDLRRTQQELVETRAKLEDEHAASATTIANTERHFRCELEKTKTSLQKEYDRKEQNQKKAIEDQKKLDKLKTRSEMDELRADIDLLGNELLKSRETIDKMQSMLDHEAEAKKDLREIKEETEARLCEMRKELESSQMEVLQVQDKLRLCEEEKREIVLEQKKRRMRDISLVEERVKKMSESYEGKLNVAADKCKHAEERAQEAEAILLQLEQNFVKRDQAA